MVRARGLWVQHILYLAFVIRASVARRLRSVFCFFFLLLIAFHFRCLFFRPPDPFGLCSLSLSLFSCKFGILCPSVCISLLSPSLPVPISQSASVSLFLPRFLFVSHSLSSSVSQSVCLSLCLSVSASVSLFLSVSLSLKLSLSPSLSVSVALSLSLLIPVYVPVCHDSLSLCVSCLSLCLSLCLCLSLSFCPSPSHFM